MKTLSYRLPILAALLLMTACEKDFLQPGNGGLLYINSFEIPDNFSGWYGYGSIDSYSAAPEGGGGSCAKVRRSTALFPHAAFDLGRAGEEMTLVLECYLKNPFYNSFGGGVRLTVNDEESVGVSITTSGSREWIKLTSAPLTCPKRGDLVLTIGAGEDILVDMLKIIVVD